MQNIIRKIFSKTPKTLSDRVCDKIEKAKEEGYAGVIFNSFDESTIIEDNSIDYKGTSITNVIDLFDNNSDSKKEPFDKSAFEKHLVKRIHMLGFIDPISLSRLIYELKSGNSVKCTPSHVEYYNSEGKEIK